MPHVWALIFEVAPDCQMEDKRVMNAKRVACFDKEESY